LRTQSTTSTTPMIAELELLRQDNAVFASHLLVHGRGEQIKRSARVNEQRAAMLRLPRAVLNILKAVHD